MLEIFLLGVTLMVLARLFKVIGTGEATHSQSRKGASAAFSSIFGKNQDSQKTTKTIDAECISIAEAGLDNSTRDVIRRIKKTDTRFDLEKFLENAKKAYLIILEAIIKNNRETLQHLLTTKCYTETCKKIDQRIAADLVMERRILKLVSVSFIDAKLDSDQATLVVSIKSEQLYSLKKQTGELLDGDDSDSTFIIESCTFLRQVGETQDKTWRLEKLASA